MHYIKNNRHIWLSMLLMLLCILFFYGDIVLHSNKYMLWVSNDGIKNSFMFSYFVKHNISWLMHEGMAYPFGEYFYITDSHPVFALIFRALGNVFTEIKEKPLAILNLIIFLSPVLTAGILSVLFKKNKVADSVNILSSVGITLFSSQFLLITLGHYSLSISFFIPLIMVMLYSFYEVKSGFVWRLLLVSVLITFAFLVHMYLGAILLGMTICFALLMFFKSWYKALYLLAGVVLAILAIVFVQSCDPFSDRVVFSMHTYFRSDWIHVLVPKLSGLDFIYKPFVDYSKFNKFPWSNIGTYIGISSIIFIITSIVLFFISICKRQVRAFIERMGEANIFILISSVVLLVFASAFPTRFDNGYTFNKMPYIWQILGLGRFAFAFYYAITFITIVFFFRLIKRDMLKYLFVLSLSGLFVVEGVGMHSHLQHIIPARENSFNENIFDEKYDYNRWEISVEEYDGIIPLPRYVCYFLRKSYEGSISSEEFSMGASVRTGLPISSIYLSRPSISNSEAIINFVDSVKYTPTQEVFKNKRFLICYTNEKLDSLDQRLLDFLSDTVYFNGKITLFSLEANEWLDNFKEE